MKHNITKLKPSPVLAAVASLLSVVCSAGNLGANGYDPPAKEATARPRTQPAPKKRAFRPIMPISVKHSNQFASIQNRPVETPAGQVAAVRPDRPGNLGFSPRVSNPDPVPGYLEAPVEAPIAVDNLYSNQGYAEPAIPGPPLPPAVPQPTYGYKPPAAVTETKPEPEPATTSSPANSVKSETKKSVTKNSSSRKPSSSKRFSFGRSSYSRRSGSNCAT